MSIVYIIGLIGSAVFAISGALAAGRKSLDLLGVIVIATVTAVGGGTLRDLLLDRPVFWMRDAAYLIVIIASALLTVPYVRIRHPPRRTLLFADAIGLAMFTIWGAQIAQQAGYTGIIAGIMGVITGTGGGVLRDVLSAEVPLLLRRGKLYATAAIAGASIYLLLPLAGVHTSLASIAGMAVVAAIRFAAILWGLRLPVFSLQDEPPE